MKPAKWCLVLFLMALLLALSGCGGAEDDVSAGDSTAAGDEETVEVEPGEAEGEEEPESDETTAPANEVKISVTPPDGWEKVEEDNALASYSKLGATFRVTRDRVPQEVDGYDAYLEFVQGKFLDVFEKIEITGTGNATIGGHDGRKLTYIMEIMGVELKGEIYYIIKDGYAYTLSCGALADEFASFEADFAQFLQSFKFE